MHTTRYRYSLSIEPTTTGSTLLLVQHLELNLIVSVSDIHGNDINKEGLSNQRDEHRHVMRLC